jgi:hypothetical protein
MSSRYRKENDLSFELLGFLRFYCLVFTSNGSVCFLSAGAFDKVSVCLTQIGEYSLSTPEKWGFSPHHVIHLPLNSTFGSQGITESLSMNARSCNYSLSSPYSYIKFPQVE